MATANHTRDISQSQRRSPCYRDAMPNPAADTANQLIFTAQCIALKYSRRTPSVADLQAGYGMSKATAYRWIAALKAAKGEH